VNRRSPNHGSGTEDSDDSGQEDQAASAHDRVLDQASRGADEKHGSIIIPDSAKEKPQEGKVIAAGTGRVTEDGKTLPLVVKAGDRILFGKYSGSEVRSTARNCSS
jgi:chaperonin GroES